MKLLTTFQIVDKVRYIRQSEMLQCLSRLYCCQIIILSIYVPSTHAYTHVLRLSLDFPYETR
jgi:hypothetical protein